jgi:hypothetical protein
MTITSKFDVVASSIAAWTITGITIKGITNIPEQAQMLCPILYPKPDNFVTNLSIPSDKLTFGTNGTEQATLIYTMTWRYLHSQIGGGLGGLFATYGSLITNIRAIAEYIANHDTVTGAANLRLLTLPTIGPVSDPTGNMYHGCDFDIYVEEYT